MYTNDQLQKMTDKELAYLIYKCLSRPIESEGSMTQEVLTEKLKQRVQDEMGPVSILEISFSTRGSSPGPFHYVYERRGKGTACRTNGNDSIITFDHGFIG